MPDQGESKPEQTEIETLLQKIDQHVNPPSGEVEFIKSEGKNLTPEQKDVNTIWDSVMLGLSDIGYEAFTKAQEGSRDGPNYQLWVRAIEQLTQIARETADGTIPFRRDLRHEFVGAQSYNERVFGYSVDRMKISDNSYRKIGLAIRPEPTTRSYSHGGETTYDRGLIMVILPDDPSFYRMIVHISESRDPKLPLKMHLNIGGKEVDQRFESDFVETGQISDRNFLLPIETKQLVSPSFKSTLEKGFNVAMMQRAKSGGGGGVGAYTALRFR